MAHDSATAPATGGPHWRFLALLPIVLLVGTVSLFASTGGSLTDLIGRNPPPRDEFDVRRVSFRPGEIRIRVTNPQRQELTIATVTVDDAIVPFSLDGPATLKRLRSSTIVVPYDWVDGDPISVGVTSSTGIQTVEEIAAAVETPVVSARGFLGYGVIGLLVGIVPVALGLLWLPSLRRADPRWLAAFMALTAGLLTFLALDALAEAFNLQAQLPSALGGTGLVLLGLLWLPSLRRADPRWLAAFMALTAGLLTFLALDALAEAFNLQAQLPSALGGTGLVLLGVALSYISLTVLSGRLARRGPRADGNALSGTALATLVAIGIGVHNLGEGLAIGSSFALGELTLGTFLVVGFMVHNVTEGLAIAAPVAERKRAVSVWMLVALALVAGAPAIPGAWIGGFLTSDFLGVLFFGAAAGAAVQVVVEVTRYIARRATVPLNSAWVLGGFLAGVTIMYVTGLFAG